MSSVDPLSTTTTSKVSAPTDCSANTRSVRLSERLRLRVGMITVAGGHSASPLTTTLSRGRQKRKEQSHTTA